MDNNIVISVNNLNKTFRIPHEKISTMRGAFVSVFKKKTYEKFKALDDVSFEVKKGEFFGIIGRNGSGKSTLLKILAGIYQADKGKIKISGRISPFLELGIGFNPELSGSDNIYLNAAILGLSKKQIDEKFDDIVRFSELKRFIDQKVKNYSSGMQVRLAFSVAIHANRDILLMDEVLAVGDVNFQQKCIAEFTKYKHLGKTVILVTHDLEVVRRYCDRTMLLREGKIIKIGNAGKVIDEYIHQNMSDEEKRMRAEEDRIEKAREQELIHAEKERVRAEKEAEKLKGKALEEEKKRIEEERKRQKEEKRKQAEERRNKVAEITRIEFLDKDANEKNVFQTGDDLSVRIYFKQNKIAENLNFGIAIFNQEDQYAFGVNTFMDKINTKKYVERGYFQIDYKNIPLKTNSYYIKVAIYGENENISYDFVPRSKIFKIFSMDTKRGMVNINYQWN